ncbi:MAG TPA: MFS transporter [Gaiellaceae bacterium]|nr:MFS transporter [Gaiellaceae bacterium]
MPGAALAHDRDSTRSQLGVLALAVVAMAASSPGQSVLIGVFVDGMLAGTNLSRTTFSALYAAGTVVSALAMLQVGRLADRFGLGLVWVVVSLGLAGACVLTSMARGVALAFLGLAFLRTFGQGAFPLLGTLLVAQTFSARRGRAMAVSSLGLTAASIVLPPLTVALIVEIGWRSAYRVLGAVLLVIVLPLAAFVRSVPSARPRGALNSSHRSVSSPRALRASRRVSALAVPSPRASRLLFVIAAPAFVLTAIIFHSVSVFAERGLSFTEAGLALSALGIASVGGTVVSGWLSDRARTRSLLSVMSSLLFAGSVLLLVPTAPTAFLAALLLGASLGVFGVLRGVVWPRTYGVAEIGRLQGMTTSVQIAAAALGPLPLALSEALTGSYLVGLLALVGYAGCALIVSIRWRDPRIVRVHARSI